LFFVRPPEVHSLHSELVLKTQHGHNARVHFLAFVRWFM
jgi:hypothetical protein